MFYKKRTIELLKREIESLKGEVKELQNEKGVWASDTGNYVKQKNTFAIRFNDLTEPHRAYNATGHLYLEEQPNYTRVTIGLKKITYYDFFSKIVKNPLPKITLN